MAATKVISIMNGGKGYYKKIKDSSMSGMKIKWNILFEFVKYFFLKSSIHGFRHMIEKRQYPMERLMWIALVGTAVYSAAILSSAGLIRYRENPTVISMERDRFSWNISFPAATICPTTKVDTAYLDVYLANASSIKNKTLFREFIISLSEATYINLDSVVHYNGISGEEYITLIKKFQSKLNPVVTNSGLSGKFGTLHEFVTEMGICYGFNSHLTIYNSLEYWNKGKWKMLPQNETFFVNPLDGEVFANLVNMSGGFQVYVHGPYEVVDIASKYLTSPDGHFLQLYLAGLTLFSSESTKSLRIQQRKCRFFYESDLRHSPVYSYVLCRMDCRAALANRLCGCTPHFYRKLDGERVCNVTGLHCLSRYKERLILLKGECSCLANCDEVNFVVEDWDSREWFLGSSLQLGLKDYPKMRMRRDVIFGFSHLLVYIGGMAGLFLGCSVLSFIEIIYFFTLRLFWFLTKYGKNSGGGNF